MTTITAFTAPVMVQGQGRSHANLEEITFLSKFTDGYATTLKVSPGSAVEVKVARNQEFGAAPDSVWFNALGTPAVSSSADDFAFRSTLKPAPKCVGQSRHFDTLGNVTCLVKFTDLSTAILRVPQP